MPTCSNNDTGNNNNNNSNTNNNSPHYSTTNNNNNSRLSSNQHRPTSTTSNFSNPYRPPRISNIYIERDNNYNEVDIQYHNNNRKNYTFNEETEEENPIEFDYSDTYDDDQIKSTYSKF